MKISVFEAPLETYEAYSEVLNSYKQTKFMVCVYGEIKSYIARIK